MLKKSFSILRKILWYLYHPIQKIYLYYFYFKLSRLLPLYAFKKHWYIVSSSWWGKSEFIKLLFYRELITKKPKGSLILIDPHGDLAEEIAKLKPIKNRKLANRVVYIDPSLDPNHSPSINPFEITDRSEKNIALMTQELKSIFSVLLQKANLTGQMDAILSPCIATLLRRPNSSFSDLQRFMDDDNNHDLVEYWASSSNLQHSLLFQTKFHSKLYAATKHGLYTRLQVLLNEPVFQNLISNKTTLDLKKLINQKKIILFKLSLWESWSESVQSYGRFIVGLLRIIAFQRSNIPQPFRTPTYLFIDEFQNFLSEDIEKALTQLRKYWLHLILANQYIGQQISPAVQKTLFASDVIIAGKNERQSISAISREMNISKFEMMSLRVGQFYIKSSSKSITRIKTPKLLLKENYTIDDNLWYLIKDRNLRKYYRSLSPKQHASWN